MRVKVEFLDELTSNERGAAGDRVIRAIDKAMGGASWESADDGWIASR